MPESDGRQLTFKRVYYGQAQSGKRTNLLRLDDQLAPELKGKVMEVKTGELYPQRRHGIRNQLSGHTTRTAQHRPSSFRARSRQRNRAR
jgi:hypothetical protein